MMPPSSVISMLQPYLPSTLSRKEARACYARAADPAAVACAVLSAPAVLPPGRVLCTRNGDAVAVPFPTLPAAASYVLCCQPYMGGCARLLAVGAPS